MEFMHVCSLPILQNFVSCTCGFNVQIVNYPFRPHTDIGAKMFIIEECVSIKDLLHEKAMFKKFHRK